MPQIVGLGDEQKMIALYTWIQKNGKSIMLLYVTYLLMGGLLPGEVIILEIL